MRVGSWVAREPLVRRRIPRGEVSVQINYAKRFELPRLRVGVNLRLAESYFERPQVDEESDVEIGLFLPQPMPDRRSYPRATRIIDLAPDPDALFRSVSKNARYKIGRASKRDNVATTLTLVPAVDDVAEFVEYYDAFAASKGVPPIRRSQFDALVNAGKLVISAARTREGVLLAAHAYLFDHPRARLSHSASLFRLEADSKERSRMGRANRLLHWDDMLRFRELGVTTYDLGGWYTENRDEALLKINLFKEEFGGTVSKEWDAYRPTSPRGRAYILMRDLMHRVRR